MHTSPAPHTSTTLDTTTTATPARRTHRIRRVLTVGLMAVLTTAGLGLASASPASAWVYDSASTSGRPGAVTAVNQIVLADIYVSPGVQNATFLSNTGPTITRSPATSGAQDAYVLYTIQRWNGSAWAQVTQGAGYGRIPAGTSQVRLPAMYIIPTSAKGYYRVTETFYWFAGGTNTQLGRSAIIPDQVSDQGCITTSRPCAAYAGYIRYGRLYSLGGGW